MDTPSTGPETKKRRCGVSSEHVAESSTVQMRKKVVTTWPSKKLVSAPRKMRSSSSVEQPTVTQSKVVKKTSQHVKTRSAKKQQCAKCAEEYSCQKTCTTGGNTFLQEIKQCAKREFANAFFVIINESL